jgi:cell division septation protein DedD
MAAENGMPENDDVRKKALLRLGVAGIVTAAALVGLWWLDQGAEEKKGAPSEAPSPTPIVPASPPEAAAPQTEAPTTETPDGKPVGTAPEEKPAGAPPGPAEPPPPPRVNNAPNRPSPAPLAGPTAARPATAPPVQAAPAATSPAAAPAPAIPAGKGFVVQLGVFSNPDNAREMVDKLNKQGIRAFLEARVQVGPFLNRQEAEKAQAEMRKLGYSALVTTAYPAK